MKSVFEQAQLFTSMWADFASRWAAATTALNPAAPPAETAREVRGNAFSTMAEYTEQFMRSPQFMEMMRQGMDNAITFRQQMNDFLTRLHHNAQGVARQDVDALMLAVRHLERRILDCMEQMSSRLEDISARLDAIESGANGEERPRRKSRKSAQPNPESQEE